VVVVVVVTTLRKRVMIRELSKNEKTKATYVVVFTEGARTRAGLWFKDIGFKGSSG